MKKNKNTLEPKCILTNRALAFTATGYLIPCCWLDDHKVWNQKWIKNFYKKDNHIDNHKTIDTIVEGSDFKEFYKMLIENSDDAPPVCRRHCGIKKSIDVNKTVIRDKFEVNAYIVNNSNKKND